MLGLAGRIHARIYRAPGAVADQDAARVCGTRQRLASVAAARLVAGVQRLSAIIRAGDDFRYIDWGLYGRTDKLYIKLFKEEEDLLTYIFIDASASMGFPERDRKFEAAVATALAMAYVALASGDRVMIRVLGGQGQSAAARLSFTDAIGSSSWRASGQRSSRRANSIWRRRWRAKWSRFGAPARSS